MSFDDFVITYFTTGPGDTPLAVRIYSMMRGDVTPEINAVSTVILVASLRPHRRRSAPRPEPRPARGRQRPSSLGPSTERTKGHEKTADAPAAPRARRLHRPRPPEARKDAAPAPASGGELHILNWAEYFADTTIPNFEKECGCKVIYDNFESGEALRAKLDHVPSGYDVVFPSDEVVPPLVTGGKLEALDMTKLPNFKNISKTFRGMSYDPQNAYTVPYMWGLTGIGWDKKKVKPAPDSWAVMFDPKNGNRMTLLDDPRENFTAALRLEGAKDLTGVTPEQIARAKKRIAAVKPKAWNSQPQSMLIQGDVVLAPIFNGDAAQVAAEGIDLGFVIPKEGGTIWFDNMAIAKGSKRIDLAHRFIDYLMRPEVAAANTNFKKYPNPNEAAKPFIDKAILEQPHDLPARVGGRPLQGPRRRRPGRPQADHGRLGRHQSGVTQPVASGAAARRDAAPDRSRHFPRPSSTIAAPAAPAAPRKHARRL